MINFVAKETIEEHNPTWTQIHLQSIVIIGGSGSGKTNSLLKSANK